MAGVALAGAMIGSATGLAFVAAKASAPIRDNVSISAAHDAERAAFAANIVSRRLDRAADMVDSLDVDVASLTVDPFRQLATLGIDGDSLKVAAAALKVDLTPVETFDLAGIDVAAIDAGDRRCLTQAIYYEARNQSLAGQMAIADVVLNRVDDRHYPDDICGVVFQGSQRTTGCQFSFTCDGSMRRPVNRAAMRRAQVVATAVLGGFRAELSRGALNYHANYVNPYWAPTLSKTAQIDDHIFYVPKRLARYASLD